VEISGNREPNRSGAGTHGNRMRTDPVARPHGPGLTGDRQDRCRQATNQRYPTNVTPFGIPDSPYLTETNARKPVIMTFSILVGLNWAVHSGLIRPPSHGRILRADDYPTMRHPSWVMIWKLSVTDPAILWLPGQGFVEKVENRLGELTQVRTEPVVRHVAVHHAPQSRDGVEVRGVRRRGTRTRRSGRSKKGFSTFASW